MAESTRASIVQMSASLERLHEIAKLFTERSRPESRVLVLHTGGTIGMIKNEQGVYAPEPNKLQQKIKQYPQLHDVDYLTTSLNYQPDQERIIVLPKTLEPKRVVYFIYEYQPLLDSSNMSIDDHVTIAKDIKSSYKMFDGFVILHGTDTLGYTAAALSFMCENLGKSIIITGAQVLVFFNNKLFRGNRTIKVSSSSLDAFNSPNMSPLVEIGTHIKVDWKSIFRSPYIEAFRVNELVNRNVGLLRIFPSITVQTIESFLRPPIQGVVLQTYGAGNFPSNRVDLLEQIKLASDRGVLILNITQCSTGSVSVDYETGKVLLDAGVIPGSDMTPEAALAKLSYILSKDEWTLENKRKKLQENLRGELTTIRTIKMDNIELISAIGKYMRLSTAGEFDSLKDILYPSILDSVAMTGDVEKLEILFLDGANLSSQDYDCRTPLHIAVCEGHTDVIKYLLRKGASVHQCDRSNKTPLMNAIEFNQHEAIKLLTKAGANFQISDHTLGEFLCNAAQHGDIKLLESFLLAGANLNQTDSNNVSALHKAVEYKHPQCVEFLLKQKVNIVCHDVYNRTPKDIALKLGFDDIIKLLNSY
ncbi:L-asparaginase [Nymphon striatum]|nr:L-asparaginase [Nymphon striatum]